MPNSVEDVVNEALVMIGWRRPIADIYEGSPAARAALEIYAQTRDEMLAAQDWPFAFREVLLGVNGQVPPSPWAFEYTYPRDCVRVRTVRPGPLTGGARDKDPRPVLYRVANNTQISDTAQVILSARGGVVLVYTGRVTFPPAWEPGFTMAFVAELAKRLALKLAQPERLRLQIALADEAKAAGAAVDDLRGPMLPTMPLAMPQAAREPPR